MTWLTYYLAHLLPILLPCPSFAILKQCVSIPYDKIVTHCEFSYFDEVNPTLKQCPYNEDFYTLMLYILSYHVFHLLLILMQ